MHAFIDTRSRNAAMVTFRVFSITQQLGAQFKADFFFGAVKVVGRMLSAKAGLAFRLILYCNW